MPTPWRDDAGPGYFGLGDGLGLLPSQARAGYFGLGNSTGTDGDFGLGGSPGEAGYFGQGGLNVSQQAGTGYWGQGAR